MAIGRQSGVLRSIERAPRRGPQSFTRRLLVDDVLDWTHGERAAELSVIPKRSHTYFAPYRPGTAQRIPPVINTGYGRQYANAERTRLTLVARARMYAAGLLYPATQGAGTAPDAIQSQTIPKVAAH